MRSGKCWSISCRTLLALRADRGAVTAEFAVVLPAVLAVLALAVGAIMLATHRVALASAAAEVARLEARGDDAAAQQRLATLGPKTEAVRERSGSLLCVTLRARPAAGLLAVVELSARGCAAIVDDPLGAGSASSADGPANGAL